MNYCVAFINDNNQKEPYKYYSIKYYFFLVFSSFFEVINKTSGTLFKLYVIVDFA